MRCLGAARRVTQRPRRALCGAVRNRRPPFLGKIPASAGPGAGAPLGSPPRPASRQRTGAFTSAGAWGHLGGPSPGQAERPICTGAVARPTLAPVATRGVDAVLGTAAPSDTALVHVCGKRGVRQGRHPQRPLETDLSEGHPDGTRGPASPVWQVCPCHPAGHRQRPGCTQLPPFWHGGWQTAVGEG